MNYRLLVLIFILMCLGCSSPNKEKVYYNDLKQTEWQNEIDNRCSTIDCSITKWYDGKRKAIVFTWDDSSFGIDGVRKVFDQYNLKTTFFVNTAIINDKYLKFRLFYKGTLNSVIKRAIKKGHEIGSHTHDHVDLSKLRLNEVEDQYVKSSNFIFDKYGFRPSTLSHPNSCYNSKIDSLTNIYFLGSRYSVANDLDTTIRYLHVRESYSFEYYKKNLDSFIESDANLYVYGGHQLEGGYEPLGGGAGTLSKLLDYVVRKYQGLCWITTLEDALMYKLIRDRISINNEKGSVFIDMSQINDILAKYLHPHAYLTLQFQGNLDFYSKGLVEYRYDGLNSYCTIDLRISNQLDYKPIDSSYIIQESMRNLKK